MEFYIFFKDYGGTVGVLSVSGDCIKSEANKNAMKRERERNPATVFIVELTSVFWIKKNQNVSSVTAKLQGSDCFNCIWTHLAQIIVLDKRLKLTPWRCAGSLHKVNFDPFYANVFKAQPIRTALSHIFSCPSSLFPSMTKARTVFFVRDLDTCWILKHAQQASSRNGLWTMVQRWCPNTFWIRITASTSL